MHLIASDLPYAALWLPDPDPAARPYPDPYHAARARQALKGRMHLMASDLPYAALWGPDPAPDRDHVFFLSGLPPGGRQSDLQRPLAAAGLGRLRVSMRARGTQVPPGAGAQAPGMRSSRACVSVRRSGQPAPALPARQGRLCGLVQHSALPATTHVFT